MKRPLTIRPGRLTSDMIRTAATNIEAAQKRHSWQTRGAHAFAPQDPRKFRYYALGPELVPFASER